MYYANFVPHRASKAQKIIVQLDVPNSLIARFRPYTLSIQTPSAFVEWTQLIYHCGRGEYLPKGLDHLSRKQLMIGPIAKCVNKVFSKMSSSTQITKDHVLRAGAGISSQPIFSGEEEVAKALDDHCQNHFHIYDQLATGNS